MKIKKPYELLVRFALDGSVSGAHVKAQSYYLNGEAIDLDTWREEPAVVAELASPELTALMEQCSLSLATQLAEAQAQRDDALIDCERLRALIPTAVAAAEG